MWTITKVVNSLHFSFVYENVLFDGCDQSCFLKYENCFFNLMQKNLLYFFSFCLFSFDSVVYDDDDDKSKPNGLIVQRVVAFLYILVVSNLPTFVKCASSKCHNGNGMGRSVDDRWNLKRSILFLFFCLLFFFFFFGVDSVIVTICRCRRRLVGRWSGGSSQHHNLVECHHMKAFIVSQSCSLFRSYFSTFHPQLIFCFFVGVALRCRLSH